MRTLFIEAKIDAKADLSRHIDKLPNNIGLVATVQHVHEIKEIKKQLKNKNVLIGHGKRTRYPSQILGCDIGAALSIANKVDAFLYIGSGMFHPKLILLKTSKPVFCFNPLTSEFKELDKKEIESLEKRKNAALKKFLSSENIGVLVSIKPGQENLKEALAIKNKLKNKHVYLFLTDALDFNELENFPFIECWVNTACPRLALDDSLRTNKMIVNLEDIKPAL